MSRILSPPAYLHLQSVAPVHNRYRLYTIRIETSNSLAGAPLIVTCAWGRIGQQLQRRVYQCESLETIEKLLLRLLRVRLRHGYGLVERGEGFPEIEVLAEFPVVERMRVGQLQLFGE